MRVLIVGLPLFAERLKNDLEEFDPENRYYVLDTYYNKWDRVKALLKIPFVDVIYSINGTLNKSRVLDLAFLFGKKVMLTWVGTDVTKAKQLKVINQKYLNGAEHYCEVEWIREELTELGINAKVLNFFNFKDDFEPFMPKNDRLQVLSYISQDREEYYGWNQIMEAATAHPEIDFTIVGTKGIGNPPSNVECLGWVDNMPELFDKTHCTIRFVQHDGLSGFVLESLFRGKHVLYSERLTHCIHVLSAEDIKMQLDELVAKLQGGELTINAEGVSFVRNNFNREVILSNLIKEMKK